MDRVITILKRSEVIQVRVSRKEKNLIKKHADMCSMTTGSYLRTIGQIKPKPLSIKKEVEDD